MGDAAGLDPETTGSRRTMDWLLLPLLVIAAAVVYYPIARFNLPVAANVDDRTSLSVLLRFHQGSANPKFFMYPTLYYYLTYAVTAWFGFSRILLTGHLLNLCLVAVTAWISYLFCVKQFGSIVAGAVAACCVFFSPTLIASGGYLCTDILLAAMSILSLDLLIRYFELGSSRAWFVAMLAVGCAIATKYTAALIFITYCLVEVIKAYQQSRGVIKADASGSPRFSKLTISVCLAGVCVVCALIAIFFPSHMILNFVAAHRTNTDARSAQDYLLFLGRLRRLAVELSVAAACLLAGVRLSRTIYECLAPKRIYMGVVVLLGVFLVTTPFSILDPGKFIYDLGALVRSNVVVAGSHQQWVNYWHWLYDRENRALVLLGFMGLGLMAYRSPWRFLVALVYVVLYVVTICTSHLGVPRYLDPILPLLYCGTGLMAHEIWKGPRGVNTIWWRTAASVLGVIVVVQMVRTTMQTNRAASDHDAFYASYQEVLRDRDKLGMNGTVLYAGFVPSVELSLDGVKTQPVSWLSLAGHPVGESMACADLLIINNKDAAASHFTLAGDGSVDALLVDPKGQGQTVLRRHGCS